jgi:hypothetical protein
MEVLALRSSVPSSSFLHKEPNLPFVRFRWCHELANRLKDNSKLGIVFLFESSELSGQIFVGGKYPT